MQGNAPRCGNDAPWKRVEKSSPKGLGKDGLDLDFSTRFHRA